VNRDAAERFLDAMNEGDLDTALALAVDDVELVGPKGSREGQEAFRDAFAAGPPRYDHLDVAIEDRWVDDDDDPDVVRAGARRILRWKDSGEIAASDPVSIRLTFRDGLISKVEPLWKPGQE
jgi:ketosteroid isomerase-like protein